MAICLSKGEKQNKNWKKLRNGEGMTALLNSKKLKDLDLNNWETVEWLYKKATGNYLDVQTVPITGGDVASFNRYVTKDFIPGLGKRKNWVQELFYLPTALMRGIKGGEEFTNRLGESILYNQRQMKNGQINIDKMMKGLYKMFTDKESSIIINAGRDFTKKEYLEFQRLERELLIAPKGDKREFQKRLVKFIGSGNENDPLGGQVLRRFTDLLQGKVPETTIEREIVGTWNILRTDSFKNLLNGSISARRTIETLLDASPNKKILLQAYEKIQSEIEALMISKRESDKFTFNEWTEREGAWIATDKRDLKVFDPVTKRTEPYLRKRIVDGEETLDTYVGIKKYSPRYVLELTDLLHNLTAYAKHGDKAMFQGKSSQEVLEMIEKNLNPTAISNRLKQAARTDDYFSLDPAYFLNKYLFDVSSFNMRARVNHAYSEVTMKLWDSVRKNNLSHRGDAKIAEYSRHLIDVITQIKDNALVSNGSPKTVLDEAVRLINGFEYMSKIGFSVKSGIKNRTQGLQNWVQFGSRGYRIAKDFKNTSSREQDVGGRELTNDAMIKRQMKRFGMMFGERAETGTMSAATEGSLDVMLVPKGFDVDSKGKLILSKKSSALTKAADLMSKGADFSSRHTPLGKWFSQQYAENQNRKNTFEISFAHAFIGEQRRAAYHEKKLTEELGHAPTKKQLYDRIERIAGNMAMESVKMIHYDYDNWAKARILQGKAGKTIGQFQHFKFAFMDYQYNMLKDMSRDVKDWKWKVPDPIGEKEMIVNPNISKVFRQTAIYAFIPALIAIVTGTDVGGFASAFGVSFSEDDRKQKGKKSAMGTPLDNPIIEETAKLLDFLGNSPNGDLTEQIAHYDSYFGKGPIISQMGPFISDMFTIAELTDFINLTGEEYEEHKGLNLEAAKSDPSRYYYQIARIFNIQGARTIWHTLPALINGNLEKAFRVETGLYKPRYIENFRGDVIDATIGNVYNNTDILPKIKTNKRRATTNQDAIDSLNLLEMESKKTRQTIYNPSTGRMEEIWQ